MNYQCRSWLAARPQSVRLFFLALFNIKFFDEVIVYKKHWNRVHWLYFSNHYRSFIIVTYFIIFLIIMYNKKSIVQAMNRQLYQVNKAIEIWYSSFNCKIKFPLSVRLPINFYIIHFFNCMRNKTLLNAVFERLQSCFRQLLKKFLKF